MFEKAVNIPKSGNFYKESLGVASEYFNSQTIVKRHIAVRSAEFNIKSTAIFGGGGSTNLFLYNHPDLANKTRFAVDNDAAKQGLYLFNGKIKVISSEEASV